MNKNSLRNFKIYIDFDGTITTKDVGEYMFLEFGDPEKSLQIINEWLDGNLNSKEVWIQLCETVKDFSESKFNEFLETMEIDPYFNEFKEYCAAKNFQVAILSDGLDYYIDKIREKKNFADLPIYSNKLSFGSKGELIPLFPHTDEECTKCANCKRNHILNSSSDDDITIYIGDGYSDTCAAEHCDFIFAKELLLKYCEQNGLPYFPFKDFSDVQRIVDQLYNKKKIKKRHQASLKRRETYMQG